MWGYHAFFPNYSSNSRGVAIIFNNNIECKVYKQKKNPYGDYLGIIIVDQDKLTLVYLYVSNTDDPHFFKRVLMRIWEMKTILCGHFFYTSH